MTNRNFGSLANGECTWGTKPSNLIDAWKSLPHNRLETWKYFIPNHVGETIEAAIELVGPQFAHGYLSPSPQEARQAAIKLCWKLLSGESKRILYYSPEGISDSTLFGAFLFETKDYQSKKINFNCERRRIGTGELTLAVDPELLGPNTIIILDPIYLSESLGWTEDRFKKFYKDCTATKTKLIFDYSEYSLGIEFFPSAGSTPLHCDCLVLGKGIGGGMVTGGIYLAKKGLFKKAYGKDPLQHTNTFHGLFEESCIISSNLVQLSKQECIDSWKLRSRLLKDIANGLQLALNKQGYRAHARGTCLAFQVSENSGKSGKSLESKLQELAPDLRPLGGEIRLYFSLHASESEISSVLERLNKVLSGAENANHSSSEAAPPAP